MSKTPEEIIAERRDTFIAEQAETLAMVVERLAAVEHKVTQQRDRIADLETLVDGPLPTLSGDLPEVGETVRCVSAGRGVDEGELYVVAELLHDGTDDGPFLKVRGNDQWLVTTRFEGVPAGSQVPRAFEFGDIVRLIEEPAANTTAIVSCLYEVAVPLGDEEEGQVTLIGPSSTGNSVVFAIHAEHLELVRSEA